MRDHRRELVLIHKHELEAGGQEADLVIRDACLEHGNKFPAGSKSGIQVESVKNVHSLFAQNKGQRSLRRAFDGLFASYMSTSGNIPLFVFFWFRRQISS